MRVHRFLKKEGTRVMLRFERGKQKDGYGLSHGVIVGVLRDDLFNLIAYEVKLDEGLTLKVTPTKLLEEK